KSLDTIQEEISSFMTKLFTSALPHDAADEIRRQLRIAHEYESVSDCIDNLERLEEKMRQTEDWQPSKFHQGITGLSENTKSVLAGINTALRTNDKEFLKEFASVKDRVQIQVKQIRSKQLEQLSNAGVSPGTSSVILSILNGYTHLFCHFENIVEALSGEA
ncbi:MAG: hypothetical protein ABGW79_00075, partial [Pirellulales bacterium]